MSRMWLALGCAQRQMRWCSRLHAWTCGSWSAPILTSARCWPASGATSPPMVLVRRVADRRVEDLAALLVANLPVVAQDLSSGCVVVIGEDSLRVRRLPIF